MISVQNIVCFKPETYAYNKIDCFDDLIFLRLNIIVGTLLYVDSELRIVFS